jgi:hypothetical protein
MPCYRCGSRQVDPDRGPSPWQRGVRHDRQVLVCPECQATHDWMSKLDRCGSCGSARLVSRLGEVECRDCGWVRPAEPPPALDPGSDAGAGSAAGSGTAGLAEEVAEALGRILGRPVTHPPS